jgi:phage tail sheath protein FI
MIRPGVNISLLELPIPVSVPLDTGTWFVVGLTDKGPSTYALVQSLDDFVFQFGDRQTYSILYDAIDTFFREGGNRVYVSRVVGPAATTGFLNIPDSSAVVSLTANANGPGVWSADYKVGVISGVDPGTFRIQVSDNLNAILEDSGDLVNQQQAVSWSAYSQYIRVSLGASAENPANLAPTAMSAGDDDRANITDIEWDAALDKFDKDLGPGQISAPGRTSTIAYGQLIDHAEASNRVAVLDFPNTSTVATLESSAASVQSRWAAGFAPWLVIPGLIPGTTRIAPPSSLICGLIARNDPSIGTNRPSAGNAGNSLYCIDLTQPNWNDLDRQSLNAAGVDVIRRMFGGIRVYGWRSLSDPINDQNWLDFANARLYMQLVAELENVGENYMFAEIDGPNGATVNGFHDALAGVMMNHFIAGELFGNTASDAFAVDTGSSINTLETLARLELHAVVTVVMAPFAEVVQIQIVKRAVTAVVPGATVAA